MRSDFQNSPRSGYIPITVPKTRIEKASVVNSEFTNRRIERHHLRSVIRRHAHSFTRGEDIKVPWIENNSTIATTRYRIPELFNFMEIYLIEIHERRIFFPFVTNYIFSLSASQVHGNLKPTISNFSSVDWVRLVED